MDRKFDLFGMNIGEHHGILVGGKKKKEKKRNMPYLIGMMYVYSSKGR